MLVLPDRIVTVVDVNHPGEFREGFQIGGNGLITGLAWDDPGDIQWGAVNLSTTLSQEMARLSL